MATISSVFPNEMPVGGSGTILIAGRGLEAATAVYFVDSSEKRVFASFSVRDDGQISAQMPPLAEGRIHVFVITGGEVAAVGRAVIDKFEGPTNMIRFGEERLFLWMKGRLSS